jgi:methylated-DNA-[protein]-cysteine S-methyltransferase
MGDRMIHTTIDSPLGELLLTGEGDTLHGLHMPIDGKPAPVPKDSQYSETAFPAARRQLREYFAGERTDFDVPVELHGTSFQVRVWQALRDIPYGDTISYAELARRVGVPSAFRAVGATNGLNPIAVIVPCHRVIGANGKLTGYAGGLERKRLLLDLEAGKLAL